MLRLRGAVLRVGAAGLDALLHLILLPPWWVLGFQVLACWEGVRTGALGPLHTQAQAVPPSASPPLPCSLKREGPRLLHCAPPEDQNTEHPAIEDVPLTREGCHFLRIMGQGTSESREEREDTPHEPYRVVILSRGLHVKQVKLSRCAGQGNGLSPVPIRRHNDRSTRLGSILLGCLCSSQPFSRGKAWQKTSDEGCLRLGIPIIPLCLSRADICNHLPNCLLSPDGWLRLSQMAATTTGSQITLPHGALGEP